MIVSSFPAIWTGSIVVDKIDNKTYKVAKVNPTNVKCITAAGALWNIHHARLRPATAEEQEAFKAQEPSAPAKPLRLGSVVRFMGTYAKKHGTAPMVVIKSKPGDLVSLCYLGGDAHQRYFPSVPTRSVELVDGPVDVKNV